MHCSTSAVHIDIGVVSRIVFKLSLQASSHTRYCNIQNNNILICTVNTGRLSIPNNSSDILLYYATTTFFLNGTHKTVFFNYIQSSYKCIL